MSRHSGAMALESLRRWRKSRATGREGRYAPNLWPVWIVAPLAVAAASALSWLVYHSFSTSQAARGAAPIEVVKTTLTLMAGLAAVLTGVYAYRKSRLSEGDAKRADAEQLTHRYSTAAEQLGHEKAAVRLAGVYAMARLADDWPKQRQQCIDVLCAYLRMTTGTDADPSEGEVRASIVRIIADHLRSHSAINWGNCDFDFTGGVFHDAGFAGVTFSGIASFSRATFTGDGASFDGAMFSGDFVSFHGATFSAEVVTFTEATFSGTAYFSEATFSGKVTVFNDATFSGNTFFDAVTFSGSSAFRDATFAGTNTSFTGAKFSGDVTLFNGATFSGDFTRFSDAMFSANDTTFNRATFSGKETVFYQARFSGRNTSFDEATFPSSTAADEATKEASFLGATVIWGPITPRTLPPPASEE